MAVSVVYRHMLHSRCGHRQLVSSAVSPSWDQIGKLAAIAVIRTALNYFLLRELHEDDPKVV